MDLSNLETFFIVLFVASGFFASGLILGWKQRDLDKERDAQKLADAILRQCKPPKKAELRAVK